MKHRDPYLVQRLLKPYENKSGIFKNGNPFSFGGGLKNGGLTDEAFTLLKEIWQYDYMGSAEFEWGAVPKSLKEIATNIKSYVSGEIEVVGKSTDYSSSPSKPVTQKAKVYYVCQNDDVEYVTEWIKKFADDNKHNYRTKESVSLAIAICNEKYADRYAGWHDIDNHYLFFTDRTMFEKFNELFGIEISNGK